MAKLYFRYGAMGSSKTANAIMVQYNYQERGQNALMLKPRMESREGEDMVGSRSGLRAPCRYVEELDSIDLSGFDCIIVDECQFLTKARVQRLADIVDNLNIPVICYGLRADFQGNLFEGSVWLMAWADTIEEIKTVCWCGRKATFNTRVANGQVVKEGEQIMLGGDEAYVALCRKHWAEGRLAPMEVRRVNAGKEAYMPLLLDADPSETMIAKYLQDGELYVLKVHGTSVAVAVVLDRGDGLCELMNLDTHPDHRGKGYAGHLVRHLVRLYRSRCRRMEVGTSPGNIAFYQRLGFRLSYVKKNFFTDHYEPIEEDGVLLTDMQMLEMEL